MTVMIQDVCHVVHAEGSVVYDAVEIELTKEQSERLRLKHDCCHFGPVAFSFNEVNDAESK
jgi:hypothetical protein